MKKFIVIILILLVLIIDICCLTARGEIDECWVLCQPDSCVNIREKPKKTSTAFGEAECCDKYYTDGTIKNGYLHLVDLASETGDGWISNVYVIYDEPYKPVIQERTIISPSRVAARRTMGGKRRIWLNDGDIIHVYAISDEWCVTNQGFIKTQFIDTGSNVRDSFGDTSPEMTYEDD